MAPRFTKEEILERRSIVVTEGHDAENSKSASHPVKAANPVPHGLPSFPRTGGSNHTEPSRVTIAPIIPGRWAKYPTEDYGDHDRHNFKSTMANGNGAEIGHRLNLPDPILLKHGKVYKGIGSLPDEFESKPRTRVAKRTKFGSYIYDEDKWAAIAKNMDTMEGLEAHKQRMDADGGYDSNPYRGQTTPTWHHADGSDAFYPHHYGDLSDIEDSEHEKKSKHRTGKKHSGHSLGKPADPGNHRKRNARPQRADVGGNSPAVEHVVADDQGVTVVDTATDESKDVVEAVTISNPTAPDDNDEKPKTTFVHSIWDDSESPADVADFPTFARRNAAHLYINGTVWFPKQALPSGEEAAASASAETQLALLVVAVLLVCGGVTSFVRRRLKI
ncbi:hypothetical protein B0A49_05793 [Cryomyces minteri]|uniref:Uncharacterized protein n=1 Tax=Cryomyces minteri TaxID=331657 RepID=A0A4U0XA90_9PEZI|nr:hypothetical protein B0A49_05793 [Cryomyces minteri]